MTDIPIDPVCGMTVQPSEAVGVSEYKGLTYYFCCAECKAIFDKNPASYVVDQTADYAVQGEGVAEP